MNLTLDSSIFVMLSPKEVTYQGAVDLAQYYVKNTTMSAEEELVVVKVTLMKKYMNRKKWRSPWDGGSWATCSQKAAFYKIPYFAHVACFVLVTAWEFVK